MSSSRDQLHHRQQHQQPYRAPPTSPFPLAEETTSQDAGSGTMSGDEQKINDGSSEDISPLNGMNFAVATAASPLAAESPSYISSASSTTGISTPYTPSMSTIASANTSSNSSTPTTNVSTNNMLGAGNSAGSGGAQAQQQQQVHTPQHLPPQQQDTIDTPNQQHPAVVQQQHSSGNRRKLSSDDFTNIPPAHPFFAGFTNQQQFYDSDGSDGSLVRHTAATRKKIEPPNNNNNSNHMKHQNKGTTPQRKERFPSFDSMASSGSLIRYTPQAGSSPTVGGVSMSRQNINNYPPPTAAAAPQSSTSSSAQSQQPINPQLLPYHERRKLKQQRSREQVGQPGQQPLPRPGPGPAPPPQMPGGGGMVGMDPRYLHPNYQQQFAMMMQQQPRAPQTGYPNVDPMAAAAFASMYGMPMPGYPGFPPASPYAPQQQGQPPPQQQQQQQQQQPGGFYQIPPYNMQVGGFPHSYGMAPPGPTGRTQQALPDAQKQQPAASTAQEQQQPQQQGPSSTQRPAQHQRQLSPYRTFGGKQDRPPMGPSRPSSSVSAAAARNQFSGTDSSSTLDSSKQRGGQQQQQPYDVPPPPPPPPHVHTTNPHYHIRADSAGSMSSLGSAGAAVGEQSDHYFNSSNDKNKNSNSRQHHRKTSSGGGFLDMLRSWSPRQKKSVPAASNQQQNSNVIDFHRRNQDFLTKSRRNNGTEGSSSSMTQQQQPTASPKSDYPSPRRAVPSEDRPPASRGTHKRLHSITNDDWEENETNKETEDRNTTKSGDGSDADSGYSTSDASMEGPNNSGDKKPSKLPAAGISTNERGDAGGSSGGHSKHYRKKHHHSSRRRNIKNTTESSSSAAALPSVASADHLQMTARWDNRSASAMVEQSKSSSSSRKHHRKKKPKNRRKISRHQNRNGHYDHHYRHHDLDGGRDDSDGSSSYDYRVWTQKRARMLEKERSKLIEQWKAEARMEAEISRREEEANRWYRQCGRNFVQQFYGLKNKAYRTMTLIEAFIANLPLTIGAVAMAVVTLGVVWFKFAEENIDTCEPVHFHSSQCTFPEFPGCFYCDTQDKMYQMAITFHWACKVTAGVLAMLFVAKAVVATRVVLDEMSQPTTASPAGLLCMTTVCVFAGRGFLGQIMVTSAAFVHLCIVIWFIYMVLAYHIMPDPSWFPNTIGIGLTAVKTWLYYPMAGHLLMAISLSLNLAFFPISLARVAMNQKISATVGWMQMGAPAISLYALTIMAQPSFEEEHPDVTQFQRVHRMVYLPCMHVMCFLSILGFLASLMSLWTRWGDFKKKDFSPAHAAFCFPTLSHANAIQAYRGAIISFANVHQGSWRMVLLYSYWLVVLLAGTIATIWITARFLYCLPRWTNLDIDDEEEPPAPYETIMTRQDMLTVGEIMRQPFVSPAVLQANETGALILARNAVDGNLRYVRSRRVRALGFEPTMNWSEMQSERETLLEYVGTHPTRRRHRTLSVPGIDFNYGQSLGQNLGTGNSGVYGALGTSSPRMRAETSSPRMFF